jgi:hypothetical protein
MANDEERKFRLRPRESPSARSERRAQPIASSHRSLRHRKESRLARLEIVGGCPAYLGGAARCEHCSRGRTVFDLARSTTKVTKTQSPGLREDLSLLSLVFASVEFVYCVSGRVVWRFTPGLHPKLGDSPRKCPRGDPVFSPFLLDGGTHGPEAKGLMASWPPLLRIWTGGPGTFRGDGTPVCDSGVSTEAASLRLRSFQASA